MDDDSEEPSESSSARASRFATGGWKEAKIDPPTPAVSPSATGVGWRAASFARGANSEANGPSSSGAQGGARQNEQSGGLGRTLTGKLPKFSELILLIAVV